MGGAVASSCGPILGGLLTLASWRWIFLVNVPVGVVALLLLTRAGCSSNHSVPLDWAGQVTGVAAIAALTYGAIEAGDVGFTDARVVGALALAVAAAAAFVLVQARVRHPMVPADLIRSRTMLTAAVTGFAFMVGYYGLPFVMSLFLQQQRGLSPLATGVVFLPMMLAGLVLTLLVPRLVARVGVRPVVVTGLVLMMVGLISLAFVSATTPIAVIAALMVLVGLAGPTFIPPITARLLNAVPGSRSGTASGIFNTSRQIGGALAVAVRPGMPVATARDGIIA
jgi:DHA2 family methylenomycin A resistance protein-like MFS transporter